MSEGVEFDSVVDGKNVKVKLLVENLAIERKCDEEYHIAYTQLMKRGILPKILDRPSPASASFIISAVIRSIPWRWA